VSSLTEHLTDNRKMEVQVENDHVFVYSACCGCGGGITNTEDVRRLRDALSFLLMRLNDRDAGAAQPSLHD
jgi:hypothetical protein